MIKFIRIFIGVMLLFVTTSAYAGTPYGKWSGLWISSANPGTSGLLEIYLRMDGDRVWGNLEVMGSAYGHLWSSFTGTIVGEAMKIETVFSRDGVEFPFSMTGPSSMGRTVSGSYLLLFPDGSFFDQGSCSLRRMTPATVSVSSVVEAGEGGQILPGKDLSLDYGGGLEFSVNATEGYAISSVNIAKKSIGNFVLQSGTLEPGKTKKCIYKLSALTADVEVQAVFEKLPEPEPEPDHPKSSAVDLTPVLELLLGAPR